MTKKITKISLITIVLLVLLACFRFSYASIGDVFDDLGALLVEGIAGLLLLGIQQLAVLFFGALNVLTGAVVGLASDGSGTVGTMADVIFNRCTLTSANFFPEVWVNPKTTNGVTFGTTMAGLVENISKYYVIVRNLSIAVLLGILLYIGIRMAISTVASDEAKYKKMLYDWTISLVLVFMLHFIIIITFYINNQLVAILSEFDDSGSFDMAALFGQAMVPGAGMDELIVYGAFTVANLAMVLTYVKRTIVLGFLIIISPLITITYAIDKIGDNKSQALNTWLREFVFSVIIQPFHCIIYIVFYGATVKTVVGVGDGSDLGKLIFAAASAFFMLKAEGIVKKIFGIQPSGIGDAIGTGAMALTAASKMFGKGKGNKIDKSKGDMPKMKNNVDTKEEKTDKDKEKEKEENAKDDNKDKGKGPNGGSDGSDQSSDSGGSDSSGGSGGSGGSDDSGGAPAGDDSGDVADANDSGDSNEPSRYKRSAGSKVASFAGRLATAPIRKVADGLLLTQAGNKAFKRNGGWGGYMGRKISGAATLAGVIAGGSVGDIKTAVSLGTAAGTIASSKHDEHEYKRTQKKLERNEEVFAGAYNDFVEAYKAEHGDVDEAEIRSAAKKIYDGGGQNLESEYERDFYSQMEQLATGGEIMGYKNGFDYVNDTMRNVQDEVILPNSDYVQKHYDVKPKKKKE